MTPLVLPDEKVPEVRSRLKLDGTLTAAHLFPQIDPEMVLDGKGVKRRHKYRGKFGEAKEEALIPRKRMHPQNLMSN